MKLREPLLLQDGAGSLDPLLCVFFSFNEPEREREREREREKERWRERIRETE